MPRLVDINLGKQVKNKVVVTNIGKLVSGDFSKGILSADTILIRDGKIAKIGMRKDIDTAGADHVVDVNGMTVTPGLIDPHTHIEPPPVSENMKWMEDSFNGGVTTIISQGESGWKGRPMDGIGTKALSILKRRADAKWRPGGGLKVHGGSLILEKGLTEEDFKEMAEAGVWCIAEIGGAGIDRYEEVAPMLQWARKYGFKVPVHIGGQAIPVGSIMTADEVLRFKPDMVVHLNGGPTAPSWSDVKKIIDESDAYVEALWNGNERMMHQMVDYLKERKQLDRLIIGTDNPVGLGSFSPVAMIRTIVKLSSLNKIPGETAIAFGTGNVARAYDLNTGIVEVGREADLLAMHCPVGSVAKDALEAIEVGDIPGMPMIMVDGEVATLRATHTSNFNRYVKVDGVERPIVTFEDWKYGPPGNPRLPWEQPQ